MSVDPGGVTVSTESSSRMGDEIIDQSWSLRDKFCQEEMEKMGEPKHLSDIKPLSLHIEYNLLEFSVKFSKIVNLTHVISAKCL